MADEEKKEELPQEEKPQETGELDALKAQLADRDTKIKQLELQDRIRVAALKAGVLPEVVGDVALLTSTRFQPEDDIAKIEKYFGKEFRTERPIYYRAAVGSGAPAVQGASGAGIIRLSREQAKDMGLVKRSYEQAQKSGSQVIFDD